MVRKIIDKKKVAIRRAGEFIKSEAGSGFFMILSALLAMYAANSGFSEQYNSFVKTHISLDLGEHFSANTDLKSFVKDVLMALFFFIIGLELKREMAEGFLSKKDQIILPLLAAVGGMALPAFVFFIFNHNIPENVHGWAIPSATDIAFALCILMLAGKGVPPAVKIFLLAIAIFDDLGAILIIALFYSNSFEINGVILGLLGVMFLFLLNKKNITAITPYVFIGIFLWFCMHIAGIHTTIAGVIVAMFVPLRSNKDEKHSPLGHAMHSLHPWIVFFILPIFAFVSAGVSFNAESMTHLFEPLSMGIALGLFFGKQIGIFFATYFAVKSGFVRMPQDATWLHIYGVSIIAGIGFTMSLFIGFLAFPEEMHNQVKMGVLFGSLISTIWGAIILRMAGKKN